MESLTITVTPKEKSAILAMIDANELKYMLEGAKSGVTTADLATYARLKINLQPEKYKKAMQFERMILAIGQIVKK